MRAGERTTRSHTLEEPAALRCLNHMIARLTRRATCAPSWEYRNTLMHTLLVYLTHARDRNRQSKAIKKGSLHIRVTSPVQSFITYNLRTHQS